MRFLKAQTIPGINADTKGLNIDPGLAEMNNHC